ncbi:GreA/GreB family elongation factor [Candidatus Nasuia deltocephalinicola]|uniref:GreA/GreB family elongation factor n=1 Tax=Candidatus Nasuia deltocephalincola TaxID=1160784 RepID=UPI00216B32AC|nr:transcription elongation factor GreA [Candidatus Nasuia deltocephalinicola]
MEKIFLSLNEIKKINNNLEKIKNKDLKEVIEEINQARLMGDLSENSEYHSAKKKKNFIEEKIKNMEKILSNSEIIEESNFKKILKIKLKNIKNNEIIEYFIGKFQTNKKNYVTEDSPIAIILKNKKVNDIIKIKKYNKELIYKILSIE